MIMESQPKTKTIKHRSFWNRWRTDAELVISNFDDGQEMPSTLPDGTPLLTKAQKMKLDFEKAGESMKGAKDD